MKKIIKWNVFSLTDNALLAEWLTECGIDPMYVTIGDILLEDDGITYNKYVLDSDGNLIVDTVTKDAKQQRVKVFCDVAGLPQVLNTEVVEL
jgi:flavorubredoxin